MIRTREGGKDALVEKVEKEQTGEERTESDKRQHDKNKRRK